MMREIPIIVRDMQMQFWQVMNLKTLNGAQSRNLKQKFSRFLKTILGEVISGCEGLNTPKNF